LIPLPPLDGSRVVYAAIPQVRDLFDKLEDKGILIIFGILLIAGPVITPIIGAITGAIMSFLIPGLTGLSL
jgi:membrane-associated protease RseP (regulator of RpoE activity)